MRHPLKARSRDQIILRDVAYIPRFWLQYCITGSNYGEWICVADSTNGLILRGKRPVCRVERHHRLEYKEVIHQVRLLHGGPTGDRRTSLRLRSGINGWDMRILRPYELRHLPGSTEGVKNLTTRIPFRGARLGDCQKREADHLTSIP
jgi:hypothetical protein